MAMKIDLSIVTDWDEWQDVRLRHIEDAMKAAGFDYVGKGRHRVTYMAPHKRFVLKFPNNQSGLDASCREADWWKTHHWQPNTRGVQFAPCRMIGGVILMMRTVVSMYGHTNGCKNGRNTLKQTDVDDCNHTTQQLPKWAGWVESCQIGILANGRWVAYDYADVYD